MSDEVTIASPRPALTKAWRRALEDAEAQLKRRLSLATRLAALDVVNAHKIDELRATIARTKNNLSKYGDDRRH
jgi:hypothetical protein